MWTIVISLLQWCLRYWKNILRWGGTMLGGLWLSFKAWDGLQNVNDWAFGHWNDVLETAFEIMGKVSSFIADFQMDKSGLAGGFLDVIEIDFAVDSLIGWGTFVVLVIEWTLVGLLIAVIGLLVALFFIRMKFKILKDATE